MTAFILPTTRAPKPWGRMILPPMFESAATGEDPVGEIIFGDVGTTDELLVKFIFTSEKLSVQVHPDDAAAQARGHRRGKDEAWFILDADPGAVLGIGTRHTMSAADLRAAAVDGSIEAMLDWKPVKAGDVFYLPAGTVHAIGAGIALLEVQQNSDITYRLYDYGRPRDLHLEDATAVATAAPFVVSDQSRQRADGQIVLVEGRRFVVERWTWSGSARLQLPEGLSGWLTVITGAARIDAMPLSAGSCVRIEGVASLSIDPGSELNFAHIGPEPCAMLS